MVSEGSEKGVFDLIFALCGYIFLNLGSKDRFAQKKQTQILEDPFMKRTLRNITVASLITLIAYIVLNTFWRAILSMVQNESLKLFLIALLTAVAFDFVLLYVSKISIGTLSKL